MPPVDGLTSYNNNFLELAEHYDDFIMARTLKRPNIWYDRIPRGAYKLFQGTSPKTNIYRGGLPVQSGLGTWTAISSSRVPTQTDQGFDNCAVGTPQRYTYAWETIEYSGYKDHWQSEPLCINDLKYVDYAKEQIALVVRTGVEFGISILENWNREMYVYQAMLSNRGMLMCEGALEFEDNATYRFSYDPFATTTDVDGDTVPYITFSAGVNLSTLNWDYLDYLRTTMADRCGEAAIGNEAGMPIWGLMLDIIDFEKMIKSDSDLREDWRNARAQQLIDGYSMGMKVYRGFALMHDARQMRFRIKGLDANGNIVATRVNPLKAGRTATFGNVPEPNPAYYRAEIGIGVIFMNEVLQNLFVPSIDTLGSGTTFGPAPGLTGLWQWVNVKDNTTNLLGEHGYFYGRFELYPKPLLFSFDTTVFAYRRCAQALRTHCAIQDESDVGTGAITVAAAAATADFDATNRRVTLTLQSKIDAGVGDAVTVTHTGGATPMTVLSDALAPKYVFGWASGAANAPTVYTQCDATTTVTA